MALNASASLFWLLLLIPFSAGIAWYFYRGNEWLSSQAKWVQWLIPSLRGLGIFFLLILLIEITLMWSHAEVENPILITVIDNSSSMRQFKDSATMQKKLNQLKQDIQERFEGKYQLTFYTIGEELKENGDIQLNEQKSHHELAFKHISEQYLNRNIGAIIFASDGNYNVGDNPTYGAEQISLTPIFTLGAGDTVPKKDQNIANLYYNDVVFLKDEFPIEVDLEAFKIKNAQVKITLSSGNKILQSQTISYKNQDYAFKQISFNVSTQKVGFQPFTVSVDYLNGEFSKSNNKKTCFIEVIDSRNKLCFVSNSSHPDIAALRSVAESNENYQTHFYTPSQMLEKGEKPDLLVWYHPTYQFDAGFNNYLLQNKIPVLYIINPNSSQQDLNKLGLFTTQNSRNQTDNVQGSFNPGFGAFELSESCKQNLDYFPPLNTKFGSVNPTGNSEVLLYQRVGNAIKKDPLIFIGRNKNQTPFGVIYGEGLWRWKLSDFMKNQSHDRFNELFTKTYAYLMVKREGTGLSVQFDKRFGKYDRIGVNANFYNASLEPITSPKIDLYLTGPKGKKYKRRFNVSQNHYNLELGNLPPGSYEWKASTLHEKKKYQKQGTFVIENISLEQSSNVANHGVLKQLAKNSGGKFRKLDQANQMLNEIENRSDITSIERMTSSFWNLLDSWVFLLFIACSFGLEWFLKRYFGAY